MTKAEEQQFRDLDQTIDFLVNRMVNRNGGTSSDAMIAEALAGLAADHVSESDYPRDLGDLERCFRTWLEAPPFLRAKMLWRLAQYTSHISEKHISLDGVRS
jgi:hypothetical protein